MPAGCADRFCKLKEVPGDTPCSRSFHFAACAHCANCLSFVSARCAAACHDNSLLLSRAIALENDLRGTLRNFGLKVGMVGKVKFEARIRELVENLPDFAVLV